MLSDHGSVTAFDLLPAIDLRDGRVVRLRQGDFQQQIDYDLDPVSTAATFAAAGARWIHVVDLDGARQGRPVQTVVVERIVARVAPSVRCQVAGGLRSAGAVHQALAAGAARVVVGTAALREPSFVTRLVAAHGDEAVVVALDVRDGHAIGGAWRPGTTGIQVEHAMTDLAAAGARRFAVTAIQRDGLLAGPDLDLLGRLVQLDAGAVIASGGVSTLADLREVAELGCVGAIVGRAIYEGRLDVREAVRTIDAMR
jgi:phosphoribosylformimino-5-aminoimidazole carboxamide ribotide isomerase